MAYELTFAILHVYAENLSDRMFASQLCHGWQISRFLYSIATLVAPKWAVHRRKKINLIMALQSSDAITDVHLKSMLDVVLESSQRQLTQLRATLKDNPLELVKKEREFMFCECAKLENIGNLQVKLDDYRKTGGIKPAARSGLDAETVNLVEQDLRDILAILEGDIS